MGGSLNCATGPGTGLRRCRALPSLRSRPLGRLCRAAVTLSRGAKTSLNSISDAELSVGVQTYKEIAMTKNPVSITQSESIVEQKPSPASPSEANAQNEKPREKGPDGVVYMHGYPVPSLVMSHKSNVVPKGGFHGADEIPPGSFHHC